jgi:hypothetical protein
LASAAVEQAREHYYEAALDEAAELLTEFVEHNASFMAESGITEELRTVLLWLGASLAKAGHHDEAVEPFVLAIRLGLEEVDRSLFPPEVTRAFEAARAQAAEAPTTSVTFLIQPEGTTVEIDGRVELTSSGSAMERQLAVGRHLVVSRRPGYRPVSEIITVADEAFTIETNLSPADSEMIAEQVALLDGNDMLDSSDPTHIMLMAQATAADLVGVVSPDEGADIVLYDANGRRADWPISPDPSESDAASNAPPPTESPVEEPRPAWRRWWFWLAIIGGAAVTATAIGLGVHYGTQNRDTFTLVISR